MFVAVAVSVLLAAVLVLSGVGKLAGNEAVAATMTMVHFPLDKLWLLAAAEMAGAVGLVAGLFWWPIGVAAAIGVILYFVGALVAHARVRDTAVAPATVLLLVGVLALALRIATV